MATIDMIPALAERVRQGKRAERIFGSGDMPNFYRKPYGPGWALVGDAFGFVDPMLSPGVFLALRSSELLADALVPWLRRRAIPSRAELSAVLTAYATTQSEMLTAWLELVAYLYDGRLAALIQAGRSWMPETPGPAKRAVATHISKHVGLLASGAATTSRYSRGLLRFLGRYGLRGVDPASLAIR
jgi:flavin-dependent dehydrogenase